MEIVPHIRIRDERLLTVGPDGSAPAPTPYPDGGDDLTGLARHLGVRFGSVCITDRGTGRAEEPHLNLYQRLAKHNVGVWVDAGPTHLEDVMDLFVAGAERVTVRLGDFDAEDLEDVLALAEGEVWLGLPFDTLSQLDRLLRREPVDRFLAAGAAGVVFLDESAIGTRRGADPSVLSRAPRQGKVFLAGGVGRVEDIPVLAEAGADGILVGSVLFDKLDVFQRLAKTTNPEHPTADDAAAHSTVRMEERRGFLPGVLPTPPPRPRVVDDRDEGR